MICFVSFSLSIKLIIMLYKNIIQIDGKPDKSLFQIIIILFRIFLLCHTRKNNSISADERYDNATITREMDTFSD